MSLELLCRDTKIAARQNYNLTKIFSSEQLVIPSKTCPYKPMLTGWTSEISLSLSDVHISIL